jgi:hypothetical protein
MQDLTDYIREFLEYYFTKVHTSFPGVVTEYNASTRRAIVQPSLKRRAGNKEYVPFPLLIDVPVIYPGTKKWTIHFPLEKGDEVAVYFSERSLDVWKDMGQDDIEDADPRRFDLCDAYCVPGLQPQEFIAAEEAGMQIIHKDGIDGDLISQVLMTDDKIEAQQKDKTKVIIEDGVITLENGTNTLKLDDAINLITTGTGLLELGNAVDSLGGILDQLFTSLENLATEGSPAAHTAKTWATANITPLKQIAAKVFKK